MCAGATLSSGKSAQLAPRRPLSGSTRMTGLVPATTAHEFATFDGCRLDVFGGSGHRPAPPETSRPHDECNTLTILERPSSRVSARALLTLGRRSATIAFLAQHAGAARPDVRQQLSRTGISFARGSGSIGTPLPQSRRQPPEDARVAVLRSRSSRRKIAPHGSRDVTNRSRTAAYTPTLFRSLERSPGLIRRRPSARGWLSLRPRAIEALAPPTLHPECNAHLFYRSATFTDRHRDISGSSPCRRPCRLPSRTAPPAISSPTL